MQAFLLLLLVVLISTPMSAQILPAGATPRGVVFAFLNETASPNDSIDRQAFGERLAGELAGEDPESFRGILPDGARFVIDSLPDLLNIDEEDSLRRVAAYVTVERGWERENWYLFCVGDSIWRLEAFQRMPDKLQSRSARAAIELRDTTPQGLRKEWDLRHMLMSDDTLCQHFVAERRDVLRLVKPLSRGTTWEQFALRSIDFNGLEEYRELDDDIPDEHRIFYSLDRSAIERLKTTISLDRVERDRRFAGAVFFVAAVPPQSPWGYGYVYAPNPESLPQVSHREFVTLKPAGENWWLYKKIKGR